MSSPLSRRRLLAVGSTGTTFALTGRLAADDDDVDADDDTGEETGDDAGDETESNGEATVAVAANVDEEDFAELQEEIMAKVEEGEIDQVEAQADLEDAQLELIAESIDALEAHAEETDALTVTETEPELGLALVDGESAELIAALDLESVAALIPAAQFDEARDGP